METLKLLTFILVLLTAADYGAVIVSATTHYEPRPLKGRGGEGGVCLSQETQARVQRDIQEQIEIHESCQANVDRLEEEIRQLQAGSSRNNPATSCLEIHQAQPNVRSGLYWIQSPSERSPAQAFCDMQRTECCGATSGGWLRVAYLNMTNPSHQCPSEWTEVTNPVRACARNIPSSGCRSETFNTRGVSYTQICGRVRGYQFCIPEAFGNFNNNQNLTINDAYVDGVSITRGSPREHVWTFAIAETDFPGVATPTALCPCSSEQTQVEVPPFVGSDYFCETGSSGGFVAGCDLMMGRGVFATDPLWDGQECNGQSTCCEFNSPPWFCRQLPESTSDSIEVRLCANQGNMDEDVLVELIELYVR